MVFLTCLLFLSTFSGHDATHGCNSAEAGRHMVSEVNLLRRTSLQHDFALGSLAKQQAYSQARCDQVSHTSCLTNEGSFSERIRRGCSTTIWAAAENVGACPQAHTVKDMLQLWNASTPHRRNMLREAYRFASADCACRDGTCYWALILTSDRCDTPVMISSATPTPSPLCCLLLFTIALTLRT